MVRLGEGQRVHPVRGDGRVSELVYDKGEDLSDETAGWVQVGFVCQSETMGSQESNL